MFSASRRDLAADLLAPPLMLATPFVSFVDYNDYSYAAAEIWISLAGLIAIGLLCGVIMALGAWWLRIVLTAGLGTLFSDLQFDFLDEQPWLRVPTFGIGMLLLCWLLRDHLSRIATPVFATMLVATLVLPSASGEASFDRTGRSADGRTSSRPAPPILVHMIFDELIGVEGIPAEANGPAYKNMLKTFFDANGFYVFGRAYSRFLYTSNAIPNSLNYASMPHYGHFTMGRGPILLRKNQYFQDMHEDGYGIHVYQTDFMDFCTGYEVQVISCRTFINTGIKPLETLKLPTVVKTEMALKTFAKLSVIQRAFNYVYDVFRREGLRRGYHPPTWVLGTPSLAAARGVEALDIVADQVTEARHGEMFFVHVLLPHQPYVYHHACGVRDPDNWDEATEDEPLPPNTAASRARRYSLYLQQVLCVRTKLQEMFDDWRRAGIYDRMKIIVQGDHGSRIYLHEPTGANKDRLLISDYTDSFSTLFAVKAPGLKPGYDTRIAAIQDLLARVAHERPLDRPAAGTIQPYVLLENGEDMMRQPMPDFGDPSRDEHRLHLSQP